MKHSKLFYTVALALAPQFCVAQQLAFSAPTEDSVPAATSSIVIAKPSAPTPDSSNIPAWRPEFDRWVDLKEFDFSARYKNVVDSDGAHEFSNGQQRGVIDGKFKFDEQGKYGIDFHASSGKTFNWSYADFIGGGNQQAVAFAVQKFSPTLLEAFEYFATVDSADIAKSYNSGGWSFYVRRLALDLEPVKGIEMQYGGLDINRGAASEITTYDNDGYISGERLLIKRPQNLFFDEASVTYAYFGDLYTPNFFERGYRLGQSNYHQFLLRKHAGKRVDTSFDYTWQIKSNTLREAALVDVHESRAVDTVRVELYQRLNAIHGFPEYPSAASPAGNGYAFTLDKKIDKRVSMEAGWASIDMNAGVLTQELISANIGLAVNGDQYGLGNRFFVRPTIKLTPYLEASGYYTKQFANTSVYAIIWDQQAFNAGLNFDMKKLLFPKSKVQ